MIKRRHQHRVHFRLLSGLQNGPPTERHPTHCCRADPRLLPCSNPRADADASLRQYSTSRFLFVEERDDTLLMANDADPGSQPDERLPATRRKCCRPSTRACESKTFFRQERGKSPHTFDRIRTRPRYVQISGTLVLKSKVPERRITSASQCLSSSRYGPGTSRRSHRLRQRPASTRRRSPSPFRRHR